MNNSQPKFQLELGNLIWLYRADRDLTVFFISASILNKGEPSVAINWKARYIVTGNPEAMELFNIIGTYEVTVGNEKVGFTNDNLLNLKTLENPIAKGQWIGGRILCTVKGNRTAQVMALQYTIEIECDDYIGSRSIGTYRPDSKPPDRLLVHYKEHLESIAGSDDEPKLLK